MARYYVNDTPQTSGDHEVHREGCRWLKLASYTTFLGEFTSCFGAVIAAKKKYPTANGCAYCSPDCNTG